MLSIASYFFILIERKYWTWNSTSSGLKNIDFVKIVTVGFRNIPQDELKIIKLHILLNLNYIFEIKLEIKNKAVDRSSCEKRSNEMKQALNLIQDEIYDGLMHSWF